MNENLKLSERRMKLNRTIMEAAISNYNDKMSVKESASNRDENKEMVLEGTMNRENGLKKYQSFVEDVKNGLVVEALYKVFSEAVSEEIKSDLSNRNVMRAIVNQYVHENDYSSIMNKMRSASVPMNNMYNTIVESSKVILENVDKTDANTFKITSDMKDEFFKQLDYSDSAAISDAINARVADAMTDFITANSKDHEDITNALKKAQEKIDDTVESDNTSIAESYNIIAKREISKINSRPKSILHSMVSAMCESVITHPEMHSEFMNEGNIDMDKVVTRTTIMYTFMEMLNTAKLDKVDENTIKSMIKSFAE